MIDRTKFIPPELRQRPDLDEAFSMPSGDFSISQTALVMRMIDLLRVEAGNRVLEVGGGTGFHAACLAARGAEVISVERLPHAAQMGARNIRDSGISGVTLVHGDGFAGVPAHAPFDRISIACATSGFPRELFQQLRVGGLLLYPAALPGTEAGVRPDILLRIEKLADVTRTDTLETIKAALRVEQIEPVFFMRGASPLLPAAQRQESYGDSANGGVVYDLDSCRPDVSFLELVHSRGGGPPLHYHQFEDEGFYVLEGAFEFIVGDRNFTLSKGQHCFAARGVPHKYVATGEGENRLFISLSPPGGERYFLEGAALWERPDATLADLQALDARFGMVLLESSSASKERFGG